MALLGLAWFVLTGINDPATASRPGAGRDPQAGAARAIPGAAGAERRRVGGSGGFSQAGDAVAVVAVPVRESVFQDTIEALGTARANESVNITAKVANRIVALYFEDGQAVKKDQILVELDGAEARADLAVAQAALGDSRSQYNRSRDLYATKALSQAQLEQIEATLRQNEARVASAQARLNDTIIRAPFSGRVGLRQVSVGSYVSPTTVMTTLDDTGVIKLDFSVPETFLSLLAAGLQVVASSSTYPGEEFRGKVASVDSRIDPVSRSVIVRAMLDNSAGKMKPGMFMSVRLVRSQENALTLPEQALVPEGERKFVFVVRDQQAHKVEIITGRRRPGEVEVLQGLSGGDLVVVEGTQKIIDGSAVRVATAANNATSS